jgi:hypothetical protein
MPAITRTEPSRMAILTESREAMNLRRQQQILANASLSSPHFAANPFLPIAAMCPIYGLHLTPPAWRSDGIGAAIMEICRILESGLQIIRLEMRFSRWT